MDFSTQIIGRSVRQMHWTDCAVIVQDVGAFSFWGKLVDIKSGHQIGETYIGYFSDPWQLVLDADLISAL
jgi:hypothetical protein